MSVNKQIVLDSRPTEKVSPANFRAQESPMPRAGEGADRRAPPLSLARPLHARPAQRRQELRQAAGARRGDGRRRGRRGRGIEERRSSSPAISSSAWAAGSISRSPTAPAGPWSTPGRSRSRPISASSACPASPPGTGSTRSSSRSRARRWWSRPPRARSAAWSASSPGSRARSAVGIAGGPEKCAYVRDALGFDACVDHKSPSFGDDMKAALPDGLDGLFENVGGEPFLQCLKRINDFGRIAICGLIASYEAAPTSLPDMRIFLVRRIKIEGFIVSDHLVAVAQGAGRDRRPRRLRQAQVSRDRARRARRRAAGARRPAARRQLRQDAGETGLNATKSARLVCDNRLR